MKNILKLLILSFALVSSFMTNAQVVGVMDSTTDFGIAIKAKPYEDSIIIRWAPTDGVAWALSKEKGVKLYKVTYNFDGSTDTVLLSQKPIFPMSLDELNKWAGSKDKYIGMAAQSLYGKNFVPSNKSPENFMEEVQQEIDAFNLRFYVAMMSADLSPNAAKGLGLRWVDKDVKKGMIYAYFVRCDTSYNDIPLRPGITKIINGKLEKQISPLGLEALSDDRVIELHWFRTQVGGFTNYYIERSDDGGKTYKRLTEDPYYSSYNPELDKNIDSSVSSQVSSILRDYQIYIDSIPENYVDYHYRIAGIDAFADVSPFTEPVIAYGIDKTPPLPVIIDSIENIIKNYVYLHWIDNEKAPDLLGYFVAKGSDIQGPFEPIHEDLLPLSTHHFIDTSANNIDKLYYVVASIDTNGNYSYSIPRLAFIVDTIPPSKPVGLVGKMSKTGLVGLQWELNTEEDMEGYRVYYSYKPNSGFIQVTQFPTEFNTFIDSVSPKSLNRTVYYKINAIDRNGNISEYSDVVSIDKPNPIPPTAPVAKKIYVENDKVHSIWIGSSSEGVSHYEIFRKTDADNEYKMIAKIEHDPMEQDFYFVDSTIKKNIRYVYTAETVDIVNVRSEKAFPVVAENNQMEILEVPTNLKAKYSEKENQIILTWDYHSKEDDYYFVIFRSENDSPMRFWNSTDKKTKTFIDPFVNKGSKYKYSIEVRQEKGVYSSERSKEVIITP